MHLSLSSKHILFKGISILMSSLTWYRLTEYLRCSWAYPCAKLKSDFQSLIGNQPVTGLLAVSGNLSRSVQRCEVQQAHYISQPQFTTISCQSIHCPCAFVFL